MKVVFDSGVVFSGAGWRGEAHRCLLAMAHRRVTAYATEETLNELSRDATTTEGIPARHITAGGRARLNVKDNFGIVAHTEKIRGLETGVNKRTSQAIPKRRVLA
jgi:hypothetical protein